MSWSLKVYSNRGTTSPPQLFERLPTELLLDIFRWSLPARNFHQKSTLIEKRGQYISDYGFTQVCALWRHISLDAPFFWENIPTLSNKSYDTSLIDLFLQRSKEVPIHVVVHLKKYNAVTDVNALFVLRLLLLNGAHRIRTAVLVLDSYLCSRLPTFNFPILERLFIQVLDKQGFALASWAKFPCHLFGKTPMLQQVINDGHYVSGPDEAEAKPRELFRGIKEYIGLPKSTKDLTYAAPTLLKCTMRGPLSRILISGPVQRLTFPVLKSLRIIHNNYQLPLQFGWYSTQTIFQYLQTPSLETLVVEGHPSVDDSDLITSHLATLLLSSNLTSLTLHIAGLKREGLLVVLRASPLLEHLDIFDSELLVFDWNELCFNQANSLPLAPALRRIVVRKGVLVALDGLRDLFLSRQSTSLYTSHCNILSIRVTFKNIEELAWGMRRSAGWEDEIHMGLILLPRGSEHALLKKWAMILLKRFVALAGVSAVRSSKIRITGQKLPRQYFSRFGLNFDDRFSYCRVFEMMEQHEVQDPRLLELTGILHVMKYFAKLQISAFPSRNGLVEGNYHIRAHAIAEKWQSLLDARKSAVDHPWTLLEDGLTMVLPNPPSEV